MAGRVASYDSNLRDGRGTARFPDCRAGKQMRRNTPADGAKSRICTKSSFQKARLALSSVSTAAQPLTRADRVTQKLLRRYNDRAIFLVGCRCDANDEARMTNDEGMTKSEARKEVRARPLVI